MLRKNKTKILEILFIFLVSLTPLLWIKGEEVLLGHDSGYRLISLPYLKSLFYSWNPAVNFGVDWGINKGFLITQLPEVLGNYLSGSLSIAQRFSFVFWFFVMGISMYIFVRNFFPERKYWIFRIFSSTFYVYNFFILQAWFIGERAKFSLYAALPLAILIIYKTIKSKYSLLKGAILFSLLLFFLNGGGSPPLYGSILLSFFLAFIFFGLIEIYKNGLKSILRLISVVIVFVFCFLVVNAYWIFPQAYLFFNIYETELSSLGGILGALRWEEVVNRYSSFINLFRLQGIPDWYSGHHPYSEPFVNNPLPIVASFLPLLVILLGLSSYLTDNKKEKRTKEIIFFALILFLVGLVFTAGSHPPLGFIYVFLINRLPGFAIFRTAFYKFAPITWFSIIFLAGHFLNRLVLRFIVSEKKKMIVGFLSVIFILFYHHPYFSDKFFNWNAPFTTKVTIPGYVEEMSKYIEDLKNGGSRILLLPPLDSEFNSDSYNWGYWSLDLLPRLSTAKAFLANDTKREELIGAMYKAIEEGDEYKFKYFAKLAGVNRILWRNDALFNNKINVGKDASFWEENLKDFRGVSLEKAEGEWRLYSLDSELYPTSIFTTPVDIGYVQLAGSTIENTFSALGSKTEANFVYSTSTTGKDVGKILSFAGAQAIEATGIYCKPGEYSEFVDQLSLSSVNFLPGSFFYKYVEKKEEELLKRFGEFPQQRIDANLGLAGKRVAELYPLVERASLDEKEIARTSQLVSQSIIRYQENIEDARSQVTKLKPIDKNSYSLKILAYLTSHKRALSGINNKYNLASLEFGNLYRFINERISSLEKEVWVTEAETNKKFLVVINEPGLYKLEIAGHIISPTSIYLDGQKVNNASQISLAAGTHRLELVYPEPENLLEEREEEIIDISKNVSERLKIKDYSYSSSSLYAISFGYRASENVRPSAVIFQDNDKLNVEGKMDRVKRDMKASNELRNFTRTFGPNFLAKKGYLGFEYQGFNKFMDEEYFEVVNPRVYKTFNPKAFFVKESPGEKLSTPKIETQKVSPTEYLVKVIDADSTFLLNFTQSYNTGWKAYFLDNEAKSNILAKLFPRKFFGKIDETRHFSLNGFSNTWLVDKTGNFEMRIVYAPQTFFYAGLVLTLLTLPAFFVLLLILARNKHVAKN